MQRQYSFDEISRQRAVWYLVPLCRLRPIRVKRNAMTLVGRMPANQPTIIAASWLETLLVASLTESVARWA